MNMKVDVDSVLRTRAPRYYRFMPRWLVRALERYICQDEINAVVEQTAGMTDAEFCVAALDYLDVAYRVEGLEKLRAIADEPRRFTFVCNHPLGGLDGICLIDLFSRLYAPRNLTPAFVVNDLLSAVEPLSHTFVPINKHGAQSREAARGVDDAFASERPLLMFPAGLCSRLNRRGQVRDLTWNKMFVQKSLEYGRTIIPLHFNGENSKFFYKFAQLRQRLGVKFNVEMIRLPREIFLGRGRRFTITVGSPVDFGGAGSLSARQAMEMAATIRNSVYTLAQ
jgi:putative hemolysin